MIESLDELVDDVWQRLDRAAQDPDDPFRTPVMTTIGKDGPHGRIVILRHVDRAKRELLIYSDSRARKIGDVGRYPRVQWVFWNPLDKVQVRASGMATAHVRDAISETHLENVPPFRRPSYASTLEPGHPIDAPGRFQNSPESPLHFAVVSCIVDSLDVLILNDPSHHRARLIYEGSKANSTWIVP